MSAKNLSREETELALTKIIKKYDEYIYRFFKLPKVKTAFEERYFSVIKNGLDMARFLSMEISVIEELIKKEEDKLTTEIAPQQKTEKKEGYADRVLKELKAKIEKYPEIRIHKDANPEIRRLLGALGDLDKKYMPPLQDALKNTNYAFNTQIMMNLDAQLRSLSGGLEGIPARLTRYLTQLNVFPRDYKSLDREEKAYILEASFFLHDLTDILKQVKPAYYSMSRDEIEKMNRVRSYLEGVIEDFRLKDFKRRSV